MKYISLMAAFCVASTLHSKETAVTMTDAQTVAHSVTMHIQRQLDPLYATLRIKTKKALKQQDKEAKGHLRARQRELQEECNDMKQEVYEKYQAEKAAAQESEHASLTHLKNVKTALQKEPSSLAAVLENAHAYVSTLLTHASLAKDAALISQLEKERKWLHDLEKTSKKANICFEEPLKRKAKKGKKQKKTKNA